MKIFKFKCRDRMFAVRAENRDKACIKLRDALLKEQENLQEDSSGIDYGYLTDEEKKAIQDYKDAIAKTNDPKLLNIFAHILKEETEHIGELSEAEGVDQVGAISVPDLTEDSASVKDKDYIVVYKENGTWKATPEENYNSRIRNANKVTDLSKFEDPREAVEYLKKYGSSGKEYKIVDNSYMDYESGEVISDKKFCPSQLRDSDKLKKLAYEFASMGNEFDRANSARSRNILSRDDAAKIAKFYQKGLEVFSQLKSEIPKISLEKDGKWRSPSDNDTLKLLEDGNHNLYWTEDSKCRALANKIEELIKEYRMKYYER